MCFIEWVRGFFSNSIRKFCLSGGYNQAIFVEITIFLFSNLFSVNQAFCFLFFLLLYLLLVHIYFCIWFSDILTIMSQELVLFECILLWFVVLLEDLPVFKVMWPFSIQILPLSHHIIPHLSFMGSKYLLLTLSLWLLCLYTFLLFSILLSHCTSDWIFFFWTTF